MRAPNPKRLIGRRIVGWDNGTSRQRLGSDGRPSHDPTIVLDNGVCIRFLVEETQDGEGYGILPVAYRRTSNGA